MALEAIEINPQLSIRAVAKIYNVNAITLSNRRNGRSARADTEPNSKKLIKSEEEAIV